MYHAFMNAGAVDHNWAKVSQNLAAAGGNPNNVVWTHLKPVKVKKNTTKHYIAKYRDEHGAYWFEIRKNANGTYGVCSDGQFVVFADKKRIVWEFENQINSNPIKCL